MASIKSAASVRFGWIAGVALAAAAAPGAAIAQGASADMVIQFLDADRDGKVSLNDYLTFQVGRIAQFDENGDGELNYKEFKASLSEAARKNAQRSFDAFNREQSLKNLTQREFLGYHAYVFKNFLDRDGDDALSAEELASVSGG